MAGNAMTYHFTIRQLPNGSHHVTSGEHAGKSIDDCARHMVRTGTRDASWMASWAGEGRGVACTGQSLHRTACYTVYERAAGGLTKELWRPGPHGTDIPELAAMRADIVTRRNAMRAAKQPA